MPLNKNLLRKSSEKISNRMVTMTTDDDEVTVSEEYFDWSTYISKTSSVSAPVHFFSHVISDQDAGFEAGMKLEVPNNSVPGTYWVARVILRCGHLLLLRYEGYQDDSKADFWCSSYSTSLHPVGWCSKSGHALRPPVDFKDKSIDWYGYLIRNLTGSRTAAGCLFGREPCLINRLRPGMYIELTDIQDPYRYWLASISALYSGRICFQYVGTCDTAFDVWLYYTSDRIHPPGWGKDNHHRMLPPKDLLQRYTKDNLLLAAEKVIPSSDDHPVLQACFKGMSHQIDQHEFERGMKLEARHPNDPTIIGAASVSRVFDNKYFLVQIDNLLRWPGDDTDSFVCHANSSGIYPIGWCQKFGLKLQSPTGFNGNFTWDAYLKYTKCHSAPDNLFPNKSIAEHEFELGMKLECVDQENPANICVATVSQIVGNTLWLAFDGESRTEQIFDARSTDLFPPGWCAASGHELQWPRPNTIEQKNRISRLRSTSHRKSRLVHLRKGHAQRISPRKIEVDSRTIAVKDSSNNINSRLKPKRSLRYMKGGRRFKRRQVNDKDDSSDVYIDPSTSVVCIQRLAVDLNTEENIRLAFRLDNPKPGVEHTTTTDYVDRESDKPARPDDVQIKQLLCLGLRPTHYDIKNDTTTNDTVDSVIGKKKRKTRKRKLSSIVAGLKRTSAKSKKPKLIDYDMKRKHSILADAVREKRSGLTSDSSLIASEANGAANVPARGSHVASPMAPNVPRTKSTMRLARQSSAAQTVDNNPSPCSTLATKSKDLPHNTLRQMPQVNGHYQVIGNIVSKDGSHKIILKYTQQSNGNKLPLPQLFPRTKTNCIIQFGHGPRPIQPKPESFDKTVELSSDDANSHQIRDGEDKECRICVEQQQNRWRKKMYRCKRFYGLCANLPQCPSKWTVQDVARFVQDARLKRHARTFVEQKGTLVQCQIIDVKGEQCSLSSDRHGDSSTFYLCNATCLPEGTAVPICN